MIILNITIFLAIIFLLNLLFKRTQKLGQTVFVALLIGLGLGAIWQTFFDKES